MKKNLKLKWCLRELICIQNRTNTLTHANKTMNEVAMRLILCMESRRSVNDDKTEKENEYEYKMETRNCMHT